MSEALKIIYHGMGNYFPALAFCEVGRFEGWLLMQHPDGQFVAVADLRPVIADMQLQQRTGEQR